MLWSPPTVRRRIEQIMRAGDSKLPTGRVRVILCLCVHPGRVSPFCYPLHAGKGSSPPEALTKMKAAGRMSECLYSMHGSMSNAHNWRGHYHALWEPWIKLVCQHLSAMLKCPWASYWIPTSSRGCSVAEYEEICFSYLQLIKYNQYFVYAVLDC